MTLTLFRAPLKSETSLPWWRQLPDRFFDGPAAGADFGGLEGLQVQGMAQLDQLIRIPLATSVAATAALSLARPGRARQEMEGLRFYEPLAAAGDAAAVFAEPPDDIEIAERRLPQLYGLGGAIPRRGLSFRSPYAPLNPEAAPSFARLRRNNTVYAEHWHHGDASRPTLIVLHGFGLDGALVNAQALSLQPLFDAGCDLLFFTFPHHGRRAELTTPSSGQGVFGRGLLHHNEVTLQAVQELRVLIGHLQARGAGAVGVTGISLGGYTAALLACVDERLACCIPVVPAVCPVDAFLDWQPTRFLLSQLMQRHGVSVADMRGLLAVHSPLSYAPAIAGERMLIIAGAGDRVSAPCHVELLHRHWPGSELCWFPGNHMLHLGRGKYVRRLQAHVKRWLM